MDLFLLRHAEAEPLNETNHFLDEKRALTDEGKKQSREVGQGLKVLGVKLDLIAASPLVRARQTAEFVLNMLDCAEPVAIWEELAPGVKPGLLLERIKDSPAQDSILLVGHEPDMGLLASYFLTGNLNAAIPFKKAGLCRMRLQGLSPFLPGELKWMLTPKILALAGKK